MEVVAGIFAPALLWATYHYHKDRHQPEPVLNLLALYVLGIAAGWLNMYAYVVLDGIGIDTDAYQLVQQENWWGLLGYCVLVIGLGEELLKLLPFSLVALRLRHFDEPIDGIIYASFLALGFASYENIWYLQRLDGFRAYARAFASPLVHIAFASIWGHLLARARLRGTSTLLAAVGGLALAAVAHGLYDFAAISWGPWARVVPPAVVAGLWLWRLHLMRRLRAAALRSPRRMPPPR